MKRIFQRYMNEEENELYKKAIAEIKKNTAKHLNILDSLIKKYDPRNTYENRFFLNEFDYSIEKKTEYFKALKEKIKKMEQCDSVKIKVATPLHPMCWSYYIAKMLTPNNKFYNFFITKVMYGFCVPFFSNKPIMLAPYVFENGLQELKEILAHELTHSLMDTKDLNATCSGEAIDDAWTLCFLF